MTGNQHASPKAELMERLLIARRALRYGFLGLARQQLIWWREGYMAAPASTRRRWKCGK
jgi:hypothetical protein